MTETDIFKKLEDLSSKIVKDFEEKPVATTLKGIVVIYLIKKGMEWLKS